MKTLKAISVGRKPLQTYELHKLPLGIVSANYTGPLTHSKDGFWLTIPLPATRNGLCGGRITPASGSGGEGCACGSFIDEQVRVCWWRRDG